MLTLRPYQQAAIDAIYAYFEEHKGNPLLVLPTAAGKALVIAAFTEGVLRQWPDQRFVAIAPQLRAGLRLGRHPGQWTARANQAIPRATGSHDARNAPNRAPPVGCAHDGLD